MTTSTTIRANPIPGYGAWTQAQRCPDCNALLKPLYYGIFGYTCETHGAMSANAAESVPWKTVDRPAEVWW